METETQEQNVKGLEVPKLSQKDAVFTFVVEAVQSAGLSSPEDTPKDTKSKVNKDVRKVVRQKLFSACRNGQVRLSKPFDDSKLKKYCSGLINNWLKKDPRFN